MKDAPRNARISLGCGYEPPGADVHVWEPPSLDAKSGVGFAGDELKTCPGYTTDLPDVFEVLRARAHWTKGQLALFDKSPHEHLLAGIEILDANVAQFERWKMTPAKDGGGGAD